MTGPPRLLVTRPQPQADEWVLQLQRRGVSAAALPLLGIADPTDLTPVQQAWQQLPQRACVMFVSPTAVQRFFSHRPAGQAWPPQVIAAGTGPGTFHALRAAGVPAAAIVTPPDAAAQFDSEALWAILQHRLAWPGRSALIVRGEGGRDWLADALRQHGAAVHFVEAYRRTAPVPDAAGQAWLQQSLAAPAAFLWLFSSSEAVSRLSGLTPGLAPGRAWGGAHALATHPRIAQAAQGLGFGHVQLVQPTLDAVAAAALQSPAVR